MWLMMPELSGSRAVALLVLGELPRRSSCRGCEGHPGKGLAGEVSPRPSALHASGLEHGSGNLCFFCPAKRGHRRGAATARAQVKGYKKGPLLLYTDSILGGLLDGSINIHLTHRGEI